MNEIIQKVGRSMSSWPVIGRLVRIAVALLQLPEWRAEQHHLITRYKDLDARVREIDRRLCELEHQQLPDILRDISKVNDRQLSQNRIQENFSKSLPVALRNIVRDVEQLKKSLG